jgi:ribosomal protein L22
MLWVAKAMAREIGASPSEAEEVVAKVLRKSVDALRKQITRMRAKRRTK